MGGVIDTAKENGQHLKFWTRLFQLYKSKAIGKNMNLSLLPAALNKTVEKSWAL